MGVFDGFVKTFLAILIAFWFFTISEYFFMGQINTTILVFLTLLIPIFMILSEFRHVPNPNRILPCLYAIPFAFWAFDVTTTFFAIDVLGFAEELNPLGWPWAILGGLIFYVPAFVFTYWLSFSGRGRYSLLIAALITALACYVGVTNLLAGLHNLSLIRQQRPTWF